LVCIMQLIQVSRNEEQRQVSRSMENNTMVENSDTQEKDVLNILMESNLYLELTLNERYLLLKHIVEYYRTLSICEYGE